MVPRVLDEESNRDAVRKAAMNAGPGTVVILPNSIQVEYIPMDYLFYKNVKQETPRLVVTYRDEGGKDLYQWGIVGEIPILSLIGSIVQMQCQLRLNWRDIELCPELALVIAWDTDEKNFYPYLHPDIPIDPLIGMLEVIKATILATHMARQAAAQQVILGPDGRPFRG